MEKTRPKTEQSLVDWSRPYLNSSRKLRYIMDARLAGQYSVKGAKEMALLALQCISMNPKDRPRMPEIVDRLENLKQFKDMAVSSGHWSASPKTRNGASNKVKIDIRPGANQRKPSPVVTSKKS